MLSNLDIQTLHEMKKEAEAEIMRFVDGEEAMTIAQMDALENELFDLDQEINKRRKG